jgi:hypothetical protein
LESFKERWVPEESEEVTEEESPATGEESLELLASVEPLASLASVEGTMALAVLEEGWLALEVKAEA